MATDNQNPETPEWSSVGGTSVPPNAYKQNGFNPGFKPPAQWVNWIWNRIYLWLMFWKALLLGRMEFSGYVRCENLEAAGGAWQIFVGPFRQYWYGEGVVSDEVEQTIFPDPANVDGADLIVAAGPTYGLYPGASYYVYMYRNPVAPFLRFNVSRTPPTTSGWKTGFVGTHRYIASFRTNTYAITPPFAVQTGVPIPFHKQGSRYSYRVNAGTQPLLTTAVIAVPGNNNVSLAAFLPAGVNARTVRYLVDWDDTTPGAVIFNINSVPWHYCNNGPGRFIFLAEDKVDNTNQINLGFQAGTVGNFTVTVLGYDEGVP